MRLGRHGARWKSEQPHAAGVSQQDREDQAFNDQAFRVWREVILRIHQEIRIAVLETALPRRRS